MITPLHFLERLMQNLPEISSVLIDLAAQSLPHSAEVEGLLNRFCTLDVCFIILAIHKILSYLTSIYDYFQSKSEDISNAVIILESIKRALLEHRNLATVASLLREDKALLIKVLLFEETPLIDAAQPLQKRLRRLPQYLTSGDDETWRIIDFIAFF